MQHMWRPAASSWYQKSLPEKDASLHMEQTPPAFPRHKAGGTWARGRCLSLALMLEPNSNMSLSYLLDEQYPQQLTCPGGFLACKMC